MCLDHNSNDNTIYVSVRGKELPGGYWDPDKGALYKSQDGGVTFGNDLLPHDTDNSWKKNAIYSLAIEPTTPQTVRGDLEGRPDIFCFNATRALCDALVSMLAR